MHAGEKAARGNDAFRGEGALLRPVRGALRSLAVLVLTGVAGGCVVGPNFDGPPDGTPSGYLSSDVAGRRKPAGLKLVRGGELPGTWWRLLGSKQLTSLVEAALENNADVEAADAAIRVAEANVLALRGGFWPTVAGKIDASRQTTPTRTLTSNHATGKSNYSLYTPQLTISYAPDLFGGLHRQVEAAEALVEVAEFQREAAVLTLTSSLAQAAIQQASFEGQIEATRRLITVQTELLQILRRQQAAGQIALPDVLVQETAAAQAKMLLPPLERQRDQQRNLIAVLTGRFPADAGGVSFRLASFHLPSQMPVSLPADLVRQRPDVRVAEANLHQANAQVGIAIAARLPQLTITGNAGSTADAIGKLFTPGTYVAMIAGSVAQTLFDGRTLAMKQRAAEETFAQQTAQYRSVVLTAFQNVADVLIALEADARAVRAAREAEIAAERSLALARQQVDQGQVSLPTLLSAQQAYLQTANARIQAEASRLTSIVALFQALGGGWWKRQPPAEDRKSHHHGHDASAAHHPKT